MYQIKDFNYYEKTKKRFRIVGDVWQNPFSYRPCIGPCMLLVRKFNPKSIEEFYRLYTESGKHSNFNKYRLSGSRDCGRTEDELYAISYEYRRRSIEKFPELSYLTVEDFMDNVFTHIIVETYYGWVYETIIVNSIIEKDPSVYVVEPDSETDAKCGVDLILRRHGDEKFIKYAQVKPRTFFTSDKRDTKDDKVNAMNKEKELKDKFGDDTQIIYYIYENYGDLLLSHKMGLLRNGDNGSYHFTYNEIIEKCKNNPREYVSQNMKPFNVNMDSLTIDF